MCLRVIILLVFSVVCSHLDAIEMQVVDGACSCYERTGRESPIKEVERSWNRLKQDSTVHTTKRGIPDEDLYEYRKEYKIVADEAYKRCVPLVNTINNLKTAKNSYYYPSDFERLFEALHRFNDFREDWDIFDRTFAHDRHLCNNAIYSRRYLRRDGYEQDIASIREHASYIRNRWMTERKKVWDTFEQIHDMCQKTHINLLSVYEYGYLLLKKGKFYNSMQEIKKLIHYSKNSNNPQYLNSETYLTMGFAASLSHEYALAVNALSEAIQKDPNCAAAHVERAIAYFELGNFDLAIKDYIASGKDSVLRTALDPYNIDFGKGLAIGACSGTAASLEELPASILHSVRGIGQLLWAGLSHPVDSFQNVVDCSVNAIDYLRSRDLSEFSEDMAPELYELITLWDFFDSKTRGEKAGYVLGKYGVNVLTCYAGAKSLQMFKELREANALCNLEALSKAPQAMGNAIAQVAISREQFFKKVWIHVDKQGKHIVGHKNYDPASLKSIFSHPDPERLLRQFAGKGVPLMELEVGIGYKEAVEFGECIGEYYDIKRNVKLPTTRGKIHYDKNGGAHIVPAPPSGPG